MSKAQFQCFGLGPVSRWRVIHSEPATSSIWPEDFYTFAPVKGGKPWLPKLSPLPSRVAGCTACIRSLRWSSPDSSRGLGACPNTRRYLINSR